jgi:hypothetical protein
LRVQLEQHQPDWKQSADKVARENNKVERADRYGQPESALANELQLNVGRRKVHILQDVNAIPHGTEWKQEIHKALGRSCFMIPIVTPGFVIGAKERAVPLIRLAERVPGRNGRAAQ